MKQYAAISGNWIGRLIRDFIATLSYNTMQDDTGEPAWDFALVGFAPLRHHTALSHDIPPGFKPRVRFQPCGLNGKTDIIRQEKTLASSSLISSSAMVISESPKKISFRCGGQNAGFNAPHTDTQAVGGFVRKPDHHH